MAKSIKLGSDTYLDDTGIICYSQHPSIRGTLYKKLGMISVTYDSELSDMRLSAIGDWLKDTSNFLPSRWMCARLKPASGATNGYFGTSSVGAIYSLSSVNYGWAILLTDNPKSVVFGTLSNGTWTWRAPTLTVVT